MAGVRPGFISLTFAPVAGPDAAAAGRHLLQLWGACAAVGMTEPLLDGLAVDIARLPEAEIVGFDVLAGRSATVEGTSRQAYLFIRHDVVGLAVALASGDTDAGLDEWAALHGTWRSATGSDTVPDALLGEAVIFTAHAELDAESIAGQLGQPVWDALRRAGLDAWDATYVTDTGFVLWEWQTGAGRRVLAAVSPLDQEPELSRWVWWSGERELAPLAQYLLNAAKLDYEERVYRLRRSALTAVVERVDAGISGVLALHGSVELAGRTSMQGLVDAQARLTTAQAEASGLVIQLTHLRALQRTVGIARRNLAMLAPPPAAAGAVRAGDFLFARDQARASVLEEQIGQDIGYAESVHERASEAQDLTMLRLQQATTHISRAQGRVTLIQTSILGALAAGITAIATLKVSFDPPEPLKLPLLLAFVALALAAPALAVHWHERYRLIDHLVAILLGAALGVLLVSVVTLPEPVAILQAAGAALGGIAGASAARFHDRGHRPASEAGPPASEV